MNEHIPAFSQLPKLYPVFPITNNEDISEKPCGMQSISLVRRTIILLEENYKHYFYIHLSGLSRANVNFKLPQITVNGFD